MIKVWTLAIITYSMVWAGGGPNDFNKNMSLSESRC